MNVGVKGRVVILLGPISYWNDCEMPVAEESFMCVTQRRFPKRP